MVSARLGTVKVIPVVLEQLYEPFSFLVQRVHVERVVFVQHCFIFVCLDQAVAVRVESGIHDRIQQVSVAEVDGIVQLGFFRIFQCIYRIGYVSVEISVILQQVGGHFASGVGVYGGDIDRVGGQFVENPFAYSFVVSFEPVVYPQPEGERPAGFRASEERIVRRHVDCPHHLFQRAFSGLALFVVCDFRCRCTDIQHFSFGQVFGCGAGCQNEHRHQSGQ